MSNTDERLSDLLARRARQGSGIHPTREGVGVAVTRRAARRRRKRAVITGLAGLCLVAGVASGLALAGDDDGRSVDPVGQPDELPALPGVGLQIDGFRQQSFSLGPPEATTEPPVTATVFRADDDLAGPFITVIVEPMSDEQVAEDERGDPIDLDGDGVLEARIDRFNDTTAITWPLSDGSIAGIGGIGPAEDLVVAYAAELYGATLDIADIPTPAGLPLRAQWTLPSFGVSESQVTYVGDGEARLTTFATNQPSYADVALASSAYIDGTYESTPLGESFLGAGQAVVKEPADGQSFAIVRTDTGITVEITGENVDVDLLREALADGAFIEFEPRGGLRPPTTSVLEPATTTTVGPVTSSTIGPVLKPLPAVTRTLDSTGEHTRFDFHDFQPTVGSLTILETLNPPCDRFAADYERLYRANRGEPYWQGWMTIEFGARFSANPEAVFWAGELGYILCSSTTDSTTFAIPIANLGEPTVTPLSGLPEILIDIPR